MSVCWSRSPHRKGQFSGGEERKGKERKSIYIAPFRTKVLSKRSVMDHTVLPANNTMPALVPKFVALVTPLCPLCRGLSQMNSPMTQTLSQKQTLHLYVAYNWSYVCGHFCDFLAYLGQNLVALATSLRRLQSEMSSLDCRPQKACP